MPNVPPAAMDPAATASGYPRFLISGMPILPIAAQVAGDEPDMAENRAQAPRLDTTRPPGTRVSHRSSASYRSAPARVEAIAAPMMMNMGIDRSAKLLSFPKNTSGIRDSDDMPSKTIRKPAETTRRPAATEMPEKRTMIVAKATKAPRDSGSISRPFQRCRRPNPLWGRGQMAVRLRPA